MRNWGIHHEEVLTVRHLAAREEMARSGKISCIIFIRDKNSKGQEISGYIDYGHRLRTDDFEAYFSSSIIPFNLFRTRYERTLHIIVFRDWCCEPCDNQEKNVYYHGPLTCVSTTGRLNDVGPLPRSSN